MKVPADVYARSSPRIAAWKTSRMFHDATFAVPQCGRICGDASSNCRRVGRPSTSLVVSGPSSDQTWRARNVIPPQAWQQATRTYPVEEFGMRIGIRVKTWRGRCGFVAFLASAWALALAASMMCLSRATASAAFSAAMSFAKASPPESMC